MPSHNLQQPVKILVIKLRNSHEGEKTIVTLSLNIRFNIMLYFKTIYVKLACVTTFVDIVLYYQLPCYFLSSSSSLPIEYSLEDSFYADYRNVVAVVVESSRLLMPLSLLVYFFLLVNQLFPFLFFLEE
jgi:hypothetical protein